MSIEDIDYLYKNSIKDNAVIFVDSSKRDKLTYPDPNSYTINFDEPFKYVYGIEILDASIPRAMYQIDENNNKLEFFIGDANTNDTNYDSNNCRIKSIEIAPQDLDLDDLVKKINDEIKEDVTVKIKPLSVSSPSSEISKIFFFSYNSISDVGVVSQSSSIFYILAWRSSMKEVLGFDENAVSSHNDYNKITLNEVKFIYWKIENIDNDESPKWVELENVAKELYWNSLTQQTQQQEQHNKETYLNTWYDGKSDDDKIRVVIPNYQTIINGTFKSGTDKGDLGKYDLIDGNSITNPNIVHVDNSSSSGLHRIQTPGIVNLVGERFITLRSDAIEQHLSSFYSGSNSIGIGLFKLGFSGYVDARFDFSSVKYKDLHPIGKLSSIDFRFERIDGELYNFRGLNHHMLISIKYLVPYKKPENFDYTLNTNYNPDLLEYKRTQYEKDDNSEDEINELANNFKKNFLEKEKEYEYSSDEDLDYVDIRNDITDSESSIDSDDSSNDDSSDDDDDNDTELYNLNNPNITPYNRFYKYS